MKFKLPKINTKHLLSINLIIILVVANLIIGLLPNPRLDLTLNKVHTTSVSLKQIIKNLDDVINITVYQSTNLPPQAKPVVDTLKSNLYALNRLNPNRLLVNYIDPSTLDLNDVISKGVQPIQFSTMEKDSFQVQNAFFGLVISYKDKTEVMPVISDVSTIEYFIASSLNKLTSTEIPTIVLASGLGQVDYQQSLTLQRFLAQNYKLSQVDFDQEDWQIPPSSLLIILSPQTDFSQDDISKLKDYMKDSAILILHDKFQVDQSLTAKVVETPNFDQFLKEYGFTIQESLVLDESSTIATFSTQTSQFLVQYPYWIKILPQNFNPQNPVTSGLNSMILNWASPIELSSEATALVSSSQNSLSSTETDLSPNQQFNLTNQQKQNHVLAALNTTSAKIGLISDSDFIKDDFLNSQDNLVFFLNLVDYLNSDDLLLNIRSKTVSVYPLKNISSQQKNIVRIINLISTPILLVAIFLISKKIQKINHTNFKNENK